MPAPSFAATVDLGHGSGCHEHTDSCYHTHTDECYGTGHYIRYDDAGWKHNWREAFCYICPNCGAYWSGPDNWRADDFSGTNKHYVCPKCKKFEWNEGSSDKAPHYDFYMDVKCKEPLNPSIIMCNMGEGLSCSKIEQCVIPKITYQLPSIWTNQNVTIDYSGTQSGSLTFTANGTKSIEVASSTGHKIRENITITNIDKTKPAPPTFQIQ